MPTIASVSRRPLSSADSVAPGASPRALAKPSDTTTSRGWPGSGARPRRIDSRSSTGAAAPDGTPIIRPMTGSATPGTSSVASNTTEASAAATPGIAARRGSSVRGARFSSANTWPKRAAS